MRNEIIDELIVNSTCPTNSLSIKIPVTYALRLVQINWADIMFAIENDYFDIEAAVEYAVHLMELDQSDDLIIELACIKANELIREEIIENYINKFVERTTVEERQEAKDKILYAVMNYLYENKQIFENPATVIEVVYDDFGFPESMKKVVSYIPSKNELDKENNLFYNNWSEYLLQQRKKKLVRLKR